MGITGLGSKLRSTHSTICKLQVLQQVAGRWCSQMAKDDVEIIIRSLTHADLPQLVSTRTPMGRPDLYGLQSWLRTDPNGLLVAIAGRDEIVGSICSVKNGDGDDGFCFGGLFYVKPEYRKRGIGQKLWHLNLQHIGHRNTGLNAPPGKLEIYRDVGGFPVHETRFTSVEYYTSSWPLDFTFLPDTPPQGISIHPFHPSHLQSILAYDFDLLGFKRTLPLAFNLTETGSIKTLVALRHDGACAGFGTVKVTSVGMVRVGPLYASEPEVADVLLRRLGEMLVREHMEGFAIVTTSANRHVMQWMNRLEIGVYDVYDRLYTKEKLDVDINKIYGQFDAQFAPF